MNLPPGFDNPTRAANLEALAVHQPELAAQLRALALPPEVRVVTGRDGSPVVQLAADADSVRWLGATSMPSISSPPILAGFDATHESVVLPSVGSGYEPVWLAERLARHAAVFVYEPEPVNVALALSVADWTAPLRAGRIVVLTGDATAVLADYLERHPGYLPPTRVYPLPVVTPGQLAERTVALQSAGQHASHAQLRQAARVAQQIQRRQLRRAAGSPRVLVLSTDAVGGAVEFTRHVTGALSALGHVTAACVPDAPGQCHRLARLTALRDHEPDVIIFLNATPGPLEDVLPVDVSVACWFLDTGPLPANAFDGVARCAHVFAASQDVADQARAAGAADVTLLDVGVDDMVFRPDDASSPSDPADTIAIFCDGGDLSPAASGIGLESHERLWHTSADLLASALAKGAPPTVEALLAHAETKIGIRLSDADLRRQFLTLLAGRLVPTVTARSAIEVLADRPGVAVWGRGWGAHEVVRPMVRGPIPGAAERNRLYRAARVVVLPLADGASVRRVLEVLAAGGHPVVRRWDRAIREQYPRLAEVLDAVPSFTSGGALRKQTEAARQSDEKGRAVNSLRAKVLSAHSLRNRLGELLAALNRDIS